MVAVFGGSLVGMPPANPAVAAQPPAHCQAGLFGEVAPRQDVGCAPAATEQPAVLAVAAGFQESAALTGLVNPTAIRFAADGRVFVAEKSGTIKIFDSLSDTTPTVYDGLATAVHNYWDRGLLGLALDPSMTGGTGNGSYVYVLYAYDHILGSGGSAPRWGDTCPTPPGPTTDGCVISGRLSRFAVTGSTITGAEQVLIEDWCQQFPSHSIGSLVFGPDGALYASGGDGASFNAADFGQFGGTSGSPPPTPLNPCGDPPTEGGALRSQDIRSTSGAPASYRTAVLADAPIAYWRLGEASGTVASDETAAHPGTYVAGPTLGVPGPLVGDANTAMTGNGTSQYVSVADSSAFRFSGTAPFSAEVWFKHTADATYRRILSAENASGQGWQIYSQSVAWGFVRNGAGASTEVTDGTPAGSGWVHAVATYDGTTMRLYENGVELPNALPSSGSLPSDSTFVIGRYGGANVSHFNGTLDEPSIYNYALSPAQVAAHYAAGTGVGGGSGDPTGLDGAILRLNPATGAGMPGNPFAGSSDANARRIIAYGLRNPFRITTRPGTNELWIGDVGYNTWEEIDRIPDATDAVAENFGWPCYEGVGTQSGYDGSNLSLCESLYSQGTGAVAAPYYTYNHSALVVPGETCPTANGSSITGMAFYPESGGSFPAAYRGGVFFADHTRNCIWFMPKGTNGQPDPTAIQTFVAGAAHPVDLVIGPNGDLFYSNFEGGTIQRITPTGGNQPPTAVIQATPTSGPAPLTVQFNGSGSSDPEGTQLAYAWDLDGDGAYDDATGVSTSRTYTNPGNVTVGLQVTDAGSAIGTDTQVIAVSNDPPTPVISTPIAGTTWRVGDLISFSGSATDPQDGTLPASALSWSLVIQHCPSSCHTHQVQTWPGVASGQFNAPDHEYPSYLELTLTATDSFGTQASVTRRLDPQTVVLSFQTAPTGLSLAVNAASSVTPFTRTVIIGSANSATATSPQTFDSATYTFSSWSDGGAQSRTITAPATNTTYTATYQTSGVSFLPVADAQIRSNQPTKNFGASTTLRVRVSQSRAYLKFTVTGLTSPPASAVLRLRVIDGSTNGGSIYRLTNTSWTETGITWNNAPAISGSPLSSLGAVTTATWVEFNLGSAITGNGTYTFAISNGNTDSVDYASRETGYDPVLVLFP
jgi:glucose/arabinose dehydrogenase